MSAVRTPAQKWSEEHRPASPEVDALEAEYTSKMTTRLRIFALARKLESDRDRLRERVKELEDALEIMESSFKNDDSESQLDYERNALLTARAALSKSPK